MFNPVRFAPNVITSITDATWNAKAFVPWNVDLFTRGVFDLVGSIGNIINIGIWIFLILSGIYLVAKVVGGLGQ